MSWWRLSERSHWQYLIGFFLHLANILSFKHWRNISAGAWPGYSLGNSGYSALVRKGTRFPHLQFRFLGSSPSSNVVKHTREHYETPETTYVNYLQYLATGSTLTADRPFQFPVPQSGTLSRISSGTRPSVQTVSDVCLKRICSLDTSAFSALEVLDDNGAI